MTLLDAPRFDEEKDRRRRIIAWSGVATFTALVIVLWIVSGFPVDWPWHWFGHMRGRSTVNRFLTDVEKNDMAGAYGVWIGNSHWQERKAEDQGYSFKRFQEDWGPNSSDNDYGTIKAHDVAAARFNGNVLVIGIYINKSRGKPLFLAYDPKSATLSFSPVELYLGP
ncbi:MAG TPA: hypothetical protein VGJ21_17420 [Terracidiphilus sp.]|jgi:hypothetical protein